MTDFNDILHEEEDAFPAIEVAEKPKFAPTPDQQEALDLMTSWLGEGYYHIPTPNLIHAGPKFKHEHPFFLLKGYAGTGKTFCIQELVNAGTFKPSEICFTAPTNKAVKVLRNYLDDAGLQACTTKTIYSLLGLSLQTNGEVKELAKPDEPVNLSQYKVIVVDEGSMVNRFLMDAIHDAFAKWKVPFIFMGDPAQLPPVGEITSPIWKIENGYALTKVLRYGNSMLDLATSIRNVVDNPFPSIKIETNPPVHRVTKPEWFDEILKNLELFKTDEAKIISWRNTKVDEYNAFIRRNIFGQQEARAAMWLPTDKIVATSRCTDLDDNILLQTDETAEILEIAEGNHPLYSEFEIYNILALDERDRKITLRVLTASGAFRLSNKLNELSMEAKGGKRYKWKEFWTLKEAFSEIRHSYAITSHRSQGSSYRKVFVDLEDLMLNRNKAEAFRSLYVSCTRQREELWIC